MSNIKPSFQKKLIILILMIFAVSGLCYGETIQITINANIPTGKLYQGDVNAAVMSLNLSLSGGAAVADTITYFGVKNTGTMTDGADVSKISMWYDNGTANNNWDAGDLKIGDLTWNAGLSGWDTSNCVIPVTPSITTRIIITISVNAASTIGRTFTAQIPNDSVVCASGDSGPSTALTNSGTKTVSLLQLEMGKITDISSGNVYPSSLNNTVMVLSMSGAANVAADTVKMFFVKNSGNILTVPLARKYLKKSKSLLILQLFLTHKKRDEASSSLLNSKAG